MQVDMLTRSQLSHWFPSRLLTAVRAANVTNLQGVRSRPETHHCLSITLGNTILAHERIIVFLT